ncbi:MAG TPA: SIMPL domain-containing protein [Gemmatimonadaceae bacterium]|nr:SIMPL domain-containing protein [Gemmatimonadaceae bacterium]
MILNRFALSTLVAVGVVAVPRTTRAQAENPVPQLTARGQGDVEITPDRAEVVWQVITRAPTAARASEANATTIRAVLDTLRRGFGLTDRDLGTAGYNLSPQMTYSSDGKPPQLVGYVATNSVRLKSDQLARLGAMLDAAITKGATSVGGLTFYASSSDEARRRALAIAVDRARRDAEAMARAAGGRLGQLLEITSEFAGELRPSAMGETAMMRAVPETPVQPSEIKVTASVTGRWRFIPGSE